MIKGHVKIELLDHKTGKLKTTERENMLTNAMAYRAGIDSNDTIALYSNENSIMPLATKGLGGDEMRIAYVLTPDKMRRACELIKLGVAAYNAKK